MEIEQEVEGEAFPYLMKEDRELGVSTQSYRGQEVLIFDNSRKPTTAWNNIHSDPGKYSSISGFDDPDSLGDPMQEKVIMLTELYEEMAQEAATPEIWPPKMGIVTFHRWLYEAVAPKETRTLDWEKK